MCIRQSNKQHTICWPQASDMTCLVEGAFSDSVLGSWLSVAVSGRYGVGSRFKLKHTRSIINAIHSGELNEAEYKSTPIFDLRVSCCCGSIPRELLICLLSQSLLVSLAFTLSLLLFCTAVRHGCKPPNHSACTKQSCCLTVYCAIQCRE